MISTGLLSQEERKTLLRFAISVGDKMDTLIYDCTAFDKDELIMRINANLSLVSANLLELQDKKQKYLSGELREQGSIDYLQNLEGEIWICKNSIKRSEKSLESLKNYKPLAQKYVDFCKSINFCANVQYYQIELTPERKEFFAKEGVFGDSGNLAFGVEPWRAHEEYSSIVFEDIEIFCGCKQITTSTSHEDYFEVEFDGALEEKFLDFENERARNSIILSKLKRSCCPQDLAGKKAKVIIKDDTLVFDVEDGRKVTFDFFGYKNVIDFYFDFAVAGKQKVDFKNGNEYIIDEIDLDHGIQGNMGESIDFIHSEVDVNLKSDDETYCSFEIRADKIFVDVK